MRSRPRAEAASSNLLALHRAAQKLAPTPHKTRAPFAAIHQLISSFRVRAGDPAGARITSISGTLATRRRRVGGFCPPPFFRLRLYGFAQLWRPKAAATEGHAALPDLRADAVVAELQGKESQQRCNFGVRAAAKLAEGHWAS